MAAIEQLQINLFSIIFTLLIVSLEIYLEQIFIFDTSNDAKNKVRDLIREGDAVLVKGSQGMRMEKIVAEIMAEPQLKKELLVRQSERWLSK